MTTAAGFIGAGAILGTAAGAGVTPSLPTTVPGGILVCVACSKNNTTHTTSTTGWSKLGQTNSGASFTSSVFVARVGAAAPNIQFGATIAGSGQVSCYASPDTAIDLTIGASSSSAGTTTTHTSTSINTTRANSAVIYADVCAANAAMTTPAGWTENIDAGSATSVTHHVLGIEALGASGSASGAISATGANGAWVQWQIELRTTAAQPAELSKIEQGLWLAPPVDQLALAKIEQGLWLTAIPTWKPRIIFC
jgi:hypothetical protein